MNAILILLEAATDLRQNLPPKNRTRLSIVCQPRSQAPTTEE